MIAVPMLMVFQKLMVCMQRFLPIPLPSAHEISVGVSGHPPSPSDANSIDGVDLGFYTDTDGVLPASTCLPTPCSICHGTGNYGFSRCSFCHGCGVDVVNGRDGGRVPMSPGVDPCPNVEDIMCTDTLDEPVDQRHFKIPRNGGSDVASRTDAPVQSSCSAGPVLAENLVSLTRCTKCRSDICICKVGPCLGDVVQIHNPASRNLRRHGAVIRKV